MKISRKGLLLAVIHLAIVCSLGGKLLYDRATRPRVWVRTMAYDPDLPIRGRYASMRLEVKAPPFEGDPKTAWVVSKPARLTVQDGVLTAVPDENGSVLYSFRDRGPNQNQAFLAEPVAFFIPEHAFDPTIRARGEELWAEVTVPRKGAPRPIRLAVKKGEDFRPLDLR
jgi:hypothetical protein